MRGVSPAIARWREVLPELWDSRLLVAIVAAAAIGGWWAAEKGVR